MRKLLVLALIGLGLVAVAYAVANVPRQPKQPLPTKPTKPTVPGDPSDPGYSPPTEATAPTPVVAEGQPA